jgi:quercetin 2,3-dioxygenase
MLNIKVHTPNEQAIGEFDGGKITEQKPIGFPGEGSKVRRIGPLFYWAWFYSKENGEIPAHPHKGFEIITYVLSGKAVHGDSLGTRSTVESGGIQVMQTGSGVYHEEEFIGPNMEGFQIWFEPNLREAIKLQPSYNQYEHEELPSTNEGSSVVKTVIGDKSPVELTVNAEMYDIHIPSGEQYECEISDGHTIAVLAVTGDGLIIDGDEYSSTSYSERDFITISSEEDTTFYVKSSATEISRIILISVPTTVDYPLY